MFVIGQQELFQSAGLYLSLFIKKSWTSCETFRYFTYLFYYEWVLKCTWMVNYISNIGHLSWNISYVKSGIYVIDKRLIAIGGPSVGLMLGHRLRRLPNIKPTLGLSKISLYTWGETCIKCFSLSLLKGFVKLLRYTVTIVMDGYDRISLRSPVLDESLWYSSLSTWNYGLPTILWAAIT